MNIIRRLRRQFILLATLAIVIIVVGALGLINLMGYYGMRTHCLDTMTYITQNGGSLPSRTRGGDSSFWNSQFGTTWPEVRRNRPT